ncbi:RNA polymerase sigma factor (sigma-70 family) [Lactobacillus colini]|uniref:RNA polymerase sigma factor (Sigma-70 family) n=1 Tax=Lactobacillus colini TaxID=1819254 RepID=A0ABS4MCK7_9LACO|nr:sigma-70 family RNA polymerase sigma factor [Lactobacillus colini]MBP2057417.1 RNA polymerase sigma factor (sigma-70 family) [Lactobacillus colini]
MIISKDAFSKAWENRKLVAGALKAAHVYTSYVAYEDLFQDGLVIYAEMLDKRSHQDRAEVDKLSFRKIIWHTLDELRKIQRTEERNSDIDLACDLHIEEQDWDLQLLVRDCVSTMSEMKQMILVKHLLGRLPLVELSKELGYSRRSLQRAKKELLAELAYQLNRL